MPCQAKAYESARILGGDFTAVVPQHFSKFDLQTLHVYKYMGKKVDGIHQHSMSQAHVRSKSNFLCAIFPTSLAPLVKSHRIELDKNSSATGLPKAMVKMGGARRLETLGSRNPGDCLGGL